MGNSEGTLPYHHSHLNDNIIVLICPNVGTSCLRMLSVHLHEPIFIKGLSVRNSRQAAPQDRGVLGVESFPMGPLGVHPLFLPS